MRWRRPLLKTVSDHVKQEPHVRSLRHLLCLLWGDRRHHEGQLRLCQQQDQVDGDGAHCCPSQDPVGPDKQHNSLTLNCEAPQSDKVPVYLFILCNY